MVISSAGAAVPARSGPGGHAEPVVPVGWWNSIAGRVELAHTRAASTATSRSAPRARTMVRTIRGRVDAVIRLGVVVGVGLA